MANYRLTFQAATQSQLDVIVGCLLGDGTITKRGDFRLKMSSASEEYVCYVHKCLLPFVRVPVQFENYNRPMRIGNKLIPNKNNKGVAACVYTHCTPLFKKLRSEWYPDGKKIVPSSLKLNEATVSNWFVQDGSNLEGHKGAIFCTDGFAIADVDRLVERLKFDLDIDSHIQFCRKKPRIYIGAAQYFDFLDKIKPYISFNCFQYKITTNSVPSDPHRRHDKLCEGQIDMIRRLYDNGKLSQKKLAEMFHVSQSLIHAIVNYVIHKSKGVA